MSESETSAPAGLGASGLALWNSITEAFDLDVWDQQQLAQACRISDRLDAINEDLKTSPLTFKNSKGDIVVHPLTVELRMSAQALQKIIAGLRLPDEEGGRTQRRGGARGSYGPRLQAVN